MEGAAISSLISSLIMVVLYFYLGQREYKIQIPYLKIFFFIFVNILFVTFLKIFFNNNIYLKYILLMIASLIFIYFIKDFLKIVSSILLKTEN